MSPDNELELYKKYPELFAEKDLDQTQTCMCWGIECGNGWKTILENLCKTINTRLTPSARCKKIFPWEDEIKEWLNNLFRKIEKSFNLPWNTLYVPERRYYQRYPTYKFTFSQIKEKFGTLRVYYNFDIGYKDSDVEDLDPEDLKNNEIKILGYIDGAIQLAECMSAVTCERCGVAGKLRQSGWVKCLCNTCNEL